MPSYPLSREEFEQKRAAGEFNPLATYEDYQEMLREREEIRREAEEAARRDGFELGAPELDLSPEDEAILDRVWANLAAEKAAEAIEKAASPGAEDEQLTPARAA
jgi:hypothetical protein